MSIRIEQATVYVGGGRRWLTLKTACRREAQSRHRNRYRSVCDCSTSSSWDEPNETCPFHEQRFYDRFIRRVARLLENETLKHKEPV